MKAEKELHICDMIRQLITSARVGNKVQYREARKELKRLKKTDTEARAFIMAAFRGGK